MQFHDPTGAAVMSRRAVRPRVCPQPPAGRAIRRACRRAHVLGLLAALLPFFSGLPAGAESRKQTRPAEIRVEVPADRIEIDDGDTATILWGPDDVETVRILGIDAPEIQHAEHSIPFGQAFGEAAAGFAKGAFAVASRIELLRCDTLDPYGRTLGYFFLNGRNYSALIIRAHLAIESVSQYGDNGFPEEAKAMLEAAREAGPVAFEKPGEYRQRMRALTDWRKSRQASPKSEQQQNPQRDQDRNPAKDKKAANERDQGKNR